MTDQRRRGALRGTEPPAAGYRGALPPQTDRLARAWVIGVVVIFVLIFALSFGKVPSTIFPSPSPVPLPSGTPVPSPSAAASASALSSLTPTASPSAQAAASIAASPTATP